CDMIVVPVYVLHNDMPPDVHIALSLHDALPICLLHRRAAARRARGRRCRESAGIPAGHGGVGRAGAHPGRSMAGLGGHLCADGGDRKSTRLKSSHVKISYAVLCVKKKKRTKT